MPALYLFNRRTLLAGDDLQLPSLAWGSVSTVQLFILVPYLLYYDIELLLTSPEKDDLNYHAYYDNDWSSSESGRIDNEDLESITIIRRSLLLYSSNNDNEDDYFTTTMERYLPTMQTAECSKSTSQYTNYTFPILLFIYLIGITTYRAMSLYYERRIFHTSSLGTPTINIQLRKPLKKLIEFKMIWLGGYNALLLLFGLCIGGVYISGYNECFPTVWWVVWFVLFITQGVQFFINFTTLISLWRVNPASSLNATSTTAIVDDEQQLQNNNSDFYTRHVDSLHRHDNVSVAEELWQNRCEGCCRVLAVSTCFMFGGKGIVSHAAEGGGEKFYGDIARALADYFADFGDGNGNGSTGLDVVPSDVGLGFVMLRHIQAQRKMLARRDALQQTNGGVGGYGSSSRLGSQTNLSAMDNSNNNVPSLSTNRTTLLFRRKGPSQNEGSEVTTTPQPNIESQTNGEEAYRSFSRTVLSPSNPDDYALVEEGAHFARHQLAIYTWILYYYQFPVSGKFRLIGRSLKAKMKCSNTSISSETTNVRGSTTYEPCSIDVEPGNAAVRNSTVVEMNEETIVGDNFLHIHEATMLAHAGLEKADVAYANFEAGFYETPYCIIIDRKWKSIVLSIRGSLTLEDCVVDVLLDPSPLDALGEKYGFAGAGQHCHGGVAECTNWLHEDLMRYVLFNRCCVQLFSASSNLLYFHAQTQNPSHFTAGRECRISRLHTTHCWTLVRGWYWRDPILHAQKHIPNAALYLLQPTWRFTFVEAGQRLLRICK